MTSPENTSTPVSTDVLKKVVGLAAVAATVWACLWVVAPILTSETTQADDFVEADVTSGSVRREVGQVLNELAARWLDSPSTQRTFAGAPVPATWASAGNEQMLLVGAAYGSICVIGQIDGGAYGTPVYVGIDESGRGCDPTFIENEL
jgi:hypothetical protein